MLSLVADSKSSLMYDSIKDDLIPFLARKQFKKALNKQYAEAQKNDSHSGSRVSIDMKRIIECSQKIEVMMNPDLELKKDQVRVMAYIDSF